MLKHVAWPATTSYRSGGLYLPVQFYLQSLTSSSNLDLLLGYFSSSSINVLSVGFANFLYRGGRIRMIINQFLSTEDREAVTKGIYGEIGEFSLDLSDIKSLKRNLDGYGKHFFNCLSWLIAHNRIEVKIIKPLSGDGISHYKSGVFSDSKNRVGFTASTNMTASGLVHNLEQLTSFHDWHDDRSTQWITDQTAYFDEIFSGQAKFVEYLNPDEIVAAIKTEFQNKDIEELLIDEAGLLKLKSENLSNDQWRECYEKALETIENITREPKFPFDTGPKSYQQTAYEKWVENNCQGIFAMATGTGKTVTALNCVLNQYRTKPANTYKVLILVPTLTLAKQWQEEAKSFNFKEVFVVSSKSQWRSTLPTVLSTAGRIPVSFVIIATYASFSKDKFQAIVTKIPSETILIADEAHNLASPNVFEAIQNIHLTKRIGLSATPKRIYDPEGTAGMEKFFGDKEPYTFSFSMEQAIKDRILCEYYYFPTEVQLTAEELERYKQITDRLVKLARMNKGGEKSKAYEILIQERKRIIHKAENKLPKAIEILTDHYKKSKTLKYTFVYVPEGETFEITEEGDEKNLENIKLIDQYRRAIAMIDERIMVNQFISGMKDREEILEQFEKGQIDVITSMKCLDEGVNLPRAENAIFCSSTGNPRQFIQRRGRILRVHKDKRVAIIHDLVVVPDYPFIEGENENFEMERGLVRKELERVMYFASLSRNPFDTEKVFQNVCNKYKLNIYTIQNELETI